MTLIIKKGRVSERDIDILKDFSKSEGFDIIHYPGMQPGEANIRNRFPEAIYFNYFREILDKERREDFIEDYLFEIRASTDERPFFSQSFKMTRMRETYESVGRKWGILVEGGYLLPWILLQAALASAILIIAPLFLIRKEPRPSATLFYVSSYFAAIGAGFIFVEIALIQKLLPVLGDPVYTVSVVLFTILVSTGTGSYLSGRLKAIRERRVNAVLLVAGATILYLLLLDPISRTLIGFPPALRYALTVVIFFPLGITMGIPFPTGISILGEKMATIIPWAWCVNAALSVLGSVVVMMVAIYIGFSAAIIIAAALYLMAWLLLRRLVSRT